MVTIMQLTDNLKSYISSQLESMSKSSPVIGFMKPLAFDKQEIGIKYVGFGSFQGNINY